MTHSHHMSKVLLLFPPHCEPSGPYVSVPSLTAFLLDKGFDVWQKDINICVFDTIFTKKYLETVWERLDKKSGQESNQDEVRNIRSTQALLEQIIDKVETAKNTLRVASENLHFYLQSQKVLDNVRTVLSALHSPAKITYSEYILPEKGKNFSDILSFAKNEENIYYDPLCRITVPSLLREDPFLVGISLLRSSQVVPALTLAYLLKQEVQDLPIVVGGPAIPSLLDQFIKDKGIFSLIDGIVYREGEEAIYQLALASESGKKWDSVPNLVFQSDGNVKYTQNYTEDLDALPTPSYMGIDLDLYLTEDVIFPLVTSRGCYWDRCAFCTHSLVYGNVYRERSVDKVISDLKTLVTCYNAKYIIFNDGSLSPSRIEKISHSILKEGLDITWMAMVRCEPKFTSSVLDTAYRAGCRLLSFGVESGSQRVLDKMEKGITVTQAREVLKRCSQKGIWNNVFFLFNFPTESFLEARATLSFLFNNKDIIDTSNIDFFSVQKGSIVYRDPERFGIEICEGPQFFSDPVYEPESSMTRVELESIRKDYGRFVLDHQMNPASLVGENVHFILIQLRQQGKEGVKRLQQEKKEKLRKLVECIRKVETMRLHLNPAVRIAEVHDNFGLQEKVYLAVNEETQCFLGINEFTKHLFEILRDEMSLRELFSNLHMRYGLEDMNIIKGAAVQLLIDRWIIASD
jgi:anaerobic magnesium-protoporphyrin IX monomethyl ester cyclase